MKRALTQRERGLLLACGVAAAVLLTYALIVEPWVARRRSLAAEHQRLSRQIELIGRWEQTSGAKPMRLSASAAELPVGADQQALLFRNKLTEQIQKAGLQARAVQLRDQRNRIENGYTVVSVDCQGRGSYEAVLNLLADLERNPYYAGLEKLSLRVDAKDRNQLNFQITAITYAK